MCKLRCLKKNEIYQNESQQIQEEGPLVWTAIAAAAVARMNAFRWSAAGQELQVIAWTGERAAGPTEDSAAAVVAAAVAVGFPTPTSPPAPSASRGRGRSPDHPRRSRHHAPATSPS